MENIYYPEDSSIELFKEDVRNLVRSNHKIKFSINHNDEYTKFDSNLLFGTKILTIFENGFDYIVMNPINKEGYVHIDIAAKGNVYDSYTIIKTNKRKGYKELISELSKKRLELFSFISQFDNGISSGEIINQNDYYRKSNLSSRLSELDEMCLIKVIGDRVNPATNILNSIYITVKPEEHKLLRDARIKQYRKRISDIVIDKTKNLSEDTIKNLNNELRRINLNLKMI